MSILDLSPAELAFWLREKFAHDEGLALTAFADHNQAIASWNEIWSGTVQVGPHEDDLPCNDSGISRHIVNWDPARALREVRMRESLLNDLEADIRDDPLDVAARHRMKLLALPYIT